MNRSIAIVLLFIAGAVNVLAQKTVTLEGERIKAVFDCKTGALVRFTDKATFWDVIGREHLGQSFQMLVPIEGDAVPFENEIRFNNINGTDQKPPKVSSGEKSVSFTWKSLYSPANRKNLPITFTATATLEDDELVFTGTVENNSDFVVEYVAWPYFGELALPDKEHDFYLDTKNYIKNLYPGFPSEHGYWGVEYHTTMAYLPSDSYIMLRNDRQGLLVHSTRDVKQFMIGSLELCPGYGIAYRHPDTDTVDGQDVRVIFKSNRVLYAPKGSVSELEPLAFSFYTGSWHKGADMVRNASGSDDSWTGSNLVWRRINASDPDALVSFARESIKNGVDVLLVSGWYKGGSDELAVVKDGYRDAIEQCRRMGIKVVLDTEFMRADYYSPLYKAELRDLAVSDPYGYRYNNRIMCPLADRAKQLVEMSYDKTFSGLEADGVSCNDIQFRVKTMFCHDAGHGHAVPQYTDSAMVNIDRRFIERAKAFNGDFKVGGTYQFDIQNDHFDFMVLGQLDGRECLRYLNPGKPIVAPVDVRNIRQDVNTCVRNQYTICYGPLFRTNSLSTYPNVVKYVEAVEAFRDSFSDYLWESDMIGHETVAVNGCTSYSVYKSRATGKRAVILVNDNIQDSVTVSVAFEGAASAKVSVATPENPQARLVSGKFDIPVLSVAIAVEQ